MNAQTDNNIEMIVELEDYDLAKYQAQQTARNQGRRTHVQFNYDLIRFTPPAAEELKRRLAVLDPKFTLAREEVEREIAKQSRFN